ncbi:MAG TPA: MarR family transcriptional regulator [Burkholderiaceae bacterium]|nr:MarR family transcriptional regulator [Burkholderiaceae bacterium]
MNQHTEQQAGIADAGLETRVWLRMLACGNLIETELRNRLREEFGTTLARFDVLAQIARPPAEPTMSELSQRLMVTKGNITDVIGRLEAEHLVARRRDSADARVLRVHLTPKGRRLVATMVPAHNAWLGALLHEFDRDELRQLDGMLGRLRTALRATRPG